MSKRIPSLISSEEKFQCKVFTVVYDALRDPNGREYSRFTVKHPGAVVILPRAKDGSLYLVKQYRHPIRGELLEFPAGTLEPNEVPLETAKREICEEIGFAAEKWTELGTLYPAPGFCDEFQHLYLAEELSEKKLMADDDEYIEVVRMNLDEVEDAIQKNLLQDAKSLGILLRAKLLNLL